jgi:anti-anti-sigma factor
MAGQEAMTLESALDLAELEFARFVLNLSEVTRVDSMGLGLLVRHASRLNKRGGTIRLAAPQPFVAHLLHITKLSSFLESYPTEEDAIQSFLKQQSPQQTQQKHGLRVLVFDPSADLCMFVQTVLSQHGFDVRTTCAFRDAKTLLRVDAVDYILVGPGTPQLSSETAAKELNTLAPAASALQLGADFKSNDAFEAAESLLHMFGLSSTSRIQEACS